MLDSIYLKLCMSYSKVSGPRIFFEIPEVSIIRR